MYATHQAARNEFEVFIVFMCLLSGVSQVFLAEVPQNISQTTTLFQTTWAWSLLVGSAVTMVGIFWREPYLGLVLELTGLIALGGVTFTYALIVLTTAVEAGSLVGVPITLAFSVAAFRRSYKIGRRLFVPKERQEAMLKEMVQRKALQAVEDAEGEIADRKQPDDEGDR